MSISRETQVSDDKQSFNLCNDATLEKSENKVVPKQECSEEKKKKNFSTAVRLLIYSYLDRSTVLLKISTLSKAERLYLVDSAVASKNKSYSIDI